MVNVGEKTTPYATMVITLDTQTGALQLQGNVLKDPNLCMRMLFEAGHRIINEEPKPVPLIAH